MSSLNLPGPLSSTIVCNICNKNLMLCTCSKSVISASMSNITSSNSSASMPASYTVGGAVGYLRTICSVCGQNVYNCTCQNIFGPVQPNTYTMNCNICGNVLSQCVCPPANMINVPFITGPWSTGATYITSPESYLSDIEIQDPETKNVFKHIGWFTIKQQSDKEGLYGHVNNVYLPGDLKDCFACLRPNVWQIRSPLVFQLNAKQSGKEDPEIHFMTLTSIESADFLDTEISLNTPYFQEIMSTLELMRLLELQRVFTKLLRRI